MEPLKKQLIKLGSQRPELQEHLRPILDAICSSKTKKQAKAKVRKDVTVKFQADKDRMFWVADVEGKKFLDGDLSKNARGHYELAPKLGQWGEVKNELTKIITDALNQ